MKNQFLLLSLLMFCLASVGNAQVTKIKDAGPDAKRINFTVLGDGYTAGEMTDFAADATNITNAFFNEPPFTNYTNFFNVHRINVVSAESGADHPSTDRGTDHPELAVNTAFDASFHWAGSAHRLLYCSSFKVSQQVAANYPASDQELVVVNTPFYGGGGGGLSVFSTAADANDLALHETGHSFMRLADEYDSGNNSERANITSQANTGNVKWKDWIGTNGVGEFARNSLTFKPVNGECMMEFLNRGFCSVCQEQTIESIYQKVSPLETTTPATANVDYNNADLDFSITSVKPIPNTLSYEWELDGNQIATGIENVTITSTQITRSTHTLLVRVSDNTTISKKNTNYVFTYEWTINNTSLPLEWVAFTARANGKINRLDWTIAEPDGSSHFLVERSTIGTEWTTIDRVAFTGAETYDYNDEFPAPGNNLYRIRAVDFDGTLTLSPIREVRNVSRNYFKVYPSVTSGPVNCEVFTEGNRTSVVSVVAADGRVVMENTLATDGGWTRHQVDLSALAPGIYTVRVVAGKEVHTQQVIRQ
ncbi:MAG: M64 family metallo-endopeptidase [Lewinella sp.]|nr:M64 family metallo-endopeptidase [Lewinella sp.]